MAEKTAGLTFVGSLYQNNLYFKCQSKHMTKLNYTKRLPSTFSCGQCRKDEREARKQEIKKAEAEQHAYYA